MVAKLSAPAANTPLSHFRRNIKEHTIISRAMVMVPASHSQAAAPLGHVVLQHTTHLSTMTMQCYHIIKLINIPVAESNKNHQEGPCKYHPHTLCHTVIITTGRHGADWCG